MNTSCISITYDGYTNKYYFFIDDVADDICIIIMSYLSYFSSGFTTIEDAERCLIKNWSYIYRLLLSYL